MVGEDSLMTAGGDISNGAVGMFMSSGDIVIGTEGLSVVDGVNDIGVSGMFLAGGKIPTGVVGLLGSNAPVCCFGLMAEEELEGITDSVGTVLGC